MSSQFDHIDVGHELAALHLTLSSEQVRAYAEAAHMPGGRFFSDEAARQEGLPGQIVPGNMSMALFSRLLSESLHGVTIKRLSATFRAPVLPGQPIIVRAVVIEKHCTDHGDLIECDLILENGEGERWVTGTATAELPAQKRA